MIPGLPAFQANGWVVPHTKLYRYAFCVAADAVISPSNMMYGWMLLHVSASATLGEAASNCGVEADGTTAFCWGAGKACGVTNDPCAHPASAAHNAATGNNERHRLTVYWTF